MKNRKITTLARRVKTKLLPGQQVTCPHKSKNQGHSSQPKMIRWLINSCVKPERGTSLLEVHLRNDEESVFMGKINLEKRGLRKKSWPSWMQLFLEKCLKRIRSFPRQDVCPPEFRKLPLGNLNRFKML
ncbi:MAG: hypothetical protein ABSG91_21300, partial [Syntrophobacteraceae bacterium]